MPHRRDVGTIWRCLKLKVPKVTRKCHPFGKLRTSSEAKPKDLVNEKKRFFAEFILEQNEGLRMTAKLSL